MARSSTKSGGSQRGNHQRVCKVYRCNGRSPKITLGDHGQHAMSIFCFTVPSLFVEAFILFGSFRVSLFKVGVIFFTSFSVAWLNTPHVFPIQGPPPLLFFLVHLFFALLSIAGLMKDMTGHDNTNANDFGLTKVAQCC
ncbi:hypothetical protein LTR56_028038, partial [Elasticomyces elasticus]